MDAQILDQLERWYHRGEYGRVVYSCDGFLRDPRYAPLRAAILFWKGNAHERAGTAWQGEAICCYREGIASAGRDRPIKARLIASLGRIYSETGDCSSFERLMTEFGRISRDGDDEVMQWGAYVWFNYGVTLDNALRFRDAAEAYTKAAELAERFRLANILGQSLHNLGGVQLQLGDLPRAAATMSQAEAFLEDEHVGHKKLSRRAEYFLAAGDLVSTQQMITAALVHPLADDMTKADVYYTWARTLHSIRRPTEAQEKALLALDYAVKAVHYPGVHRINQFLQQTNPQSVSS